MCARCIKEGRGNHLFMWGHESKSQVQGSWLWLGGSREAVSIRRTRARRQVVDQASIGLSAYKAARGGGGSQ
jgi:hypothetical protein